jgi:hypothetical protein
MFCCFVLLQIFEDVLQVGKVSPAPESLPTNQRREKKEDTAK